MTTFNYSTNHNVSVLDVTLLGDPLGVDAWQITYSSPSGTELRTCSLRFVDSTVHELNRKMNREYPITFQLHSLVCAYSFDYFKSTRSVPILLDYLVDISIIIAPQLIYNTSCAPHEIDSGIKLMDSAILPSTQAAIKHWALTNDHVLASAELDHFSRVVHDTARYVNHSRASYDCVRALLASNLDA